MREPRVLVEPDFASAARRASDFWIESAREAARARGEFRVTLSGSSTPQALHRLLSGPRAAEVPWAACRFFFGDDRCVPPDDPNSNYRAARESLFEPAAVPADRIWRVEGERLVTEAALRYDAALRRYFGSGTPVFDLVQLGLGPDGHTASLFPGSPALEEKQRWAVASIASAEPRERVTMTLPVINAARRVLFLVEGEQKAEAVRRALRVGDVPASRVRPDGELIWVLDAAAARALG